MNHYYSMIKQVIYLFDIGYNQKTQPEHDLDNYQKLKT